MEEIKIFNSPQFGEIRTAGTSENPMFCLPDLCRVLDLIPSKVAQRLSEDVLSKYPLETAGGVQKINFVNEDGLYDVILDSRKPESRKFRKWVTSEVLPSIRKQGGYMTAKADESPEEIMARALQSLTILSLDVKPVSINSNPKTSSKRKNSKMPPRKSTTTTKHYNQ